METGFLIRTAAATAILVAPLGAHARPRDMICRELRTIVAAAAEEPSFASMTWRPHSPGLGFDNCSLLESLSPDGGPLNFGCISDFPDSAGHWQRLNGDILRCLAGARRVADPDFSLPRPPDHLAHFRAGRIRIDTHEAGYANRPERYVAIHIEAQSED